MASGVPEWDLATLRNLRIPEVVPWSVVLLLHKKMFVNEDHLMLGVGLKSYFLLSISFHALELFGDF